MQTRGEGVENDELVQWYLEEVEGDLQSQEDLQAEHDLVKKVLKRMLKVGLILRK